MVGETHVLLELAPREGARNPQHSLSSESLEDVEFVTPSLSQTALCSWVTAPPAHSAIYNSLGLSILLRASSGFRDWMG